MRLFFQRRQKKTLRGFYRFRLWARFDLAHEEQELVRKYRVEDTILSEGDPLRDLKRASWRAGPIALLIALLVYGYTPFSVGGVLIWGVTPAIIAGLVSFVVLGWLIAAVIAVHTAVTIVIPRTEKLAPLRETLRSWHYLMGLVLFVLVVLRLVRWFRERPVAPAPGMTPAGHVFARQLSLTVYLVMAAMPVLGILQAWSDGLTVNLGPFVTLPDLVPECRSGDITLRRSAFSARFICLERAAARS